MILDNKTCTIGKLNLIGLTLPHQYYYRNENYTRIHENKALLKKLIKTIKTKEHYYNLALIHSPYHLDQKTLNLVKNLDLVIAGHAHNGCVPPLISKIFRGDRGIASADKRPFAKRSRNTFKKSKGRLITLGAITTLPDTLKRLDRAFPSEIAELTFTSDPFISVPKSCIIKI